MNYQGKQVAILGFGSEGKSAYQYFKSKGAEITIHDQQTQLKAPKGVKTVLGEYYLKNLSGYDLVVRSPGVLPGSFKTTAAVTTTTNIFMEDCHNFMIGVTGTKGKGTTASLIAAMLKAAGNTVYLGGNIGTPPLDFLSQLKAEDLVVLELSNLQLWDARFSPDVAVMLPITPDHMDWHKGDMDEYVATKANITKFQTAEDLLVYHKSNRYTSKIAKWSKARKHAYPDQQTALVEAGVIKLGGKEVVAASEVLIPGEHNLQNICAALAAVQELVEDTDALAAAVKNFKGLEHRLELVREVRGIRYINDSMGTTPEAAIAAIKAFTQPKVLILGGFDKGVEFDQLAQAIKDSNVAHVVLIGKTAPRINKALDSVGFKNTSRASGDMADIVTAASQQAKAGDVVMLAPACASFDMFKNVYDRGQQFKTAVDNLPE